MSLTDITNKLSHTHKNQYIIKNNTTMALCVCHYRYYETIEICAFILSAIGMYI